MTQSVAIKMIPGAILHDAIMAALRAQGLTLGGWAKDNGVDAGKARYGTFGISSGKQGTSLRERIIDHAGRPLVEQIYTSRMLAEADMLRSVTV